MADKFDSLFYLDKVDHQELLQVLLSYFGRSRGLKGGGFRFQKSEGSPLYLDVVTNKDGIIVSLRPSSLFSEAELNEVSCFIQDKLIENQEESVGQCAAFSNARVEGWFRYKDMFQFLPVPKQAPKPCITNDNPFLFQYAYKAGPDTMVDFSRRRKKEATYARVLNVLLNRRVWLEPRYGRHVWVIRPKGSRVSEHLQEIYAYEGFGRKIESFTYCKSVPKITVVESRKYYAEFIPPGNLMRIPDNLEKSLNLVFHLSEAEYKRFLTALAWVAQSERIWEHSHSAAFIGMVSAIEPLMDRKNVRRCPTCDQVRYVTKRFKAFLLKYAPFIDEFPETRDRLYETRSSLVHGVRMFNEDLYSTVPIMDAKSEEERRLWMESHFVISSAIRGWLWDR